MREHATKTTLVFLSVYIEAFWLLLRSSVSLLPASTYSATRKHLSPYPQSDGPGLKKQKKDKHQY